MGARGEKLLTASDLAALCEVDLKTIHNWVERGRIAHFRTPGRHLRFRAVDVAEFLRAWGYAVPRELARAGAPSILVIGSPDSLGHVQRSIGEGYATRHAHHPYDALVMTGAEPADVHVLDVRAFGAEIDLVSLLEALHRATPQAVFAVLSDDPVDVPAFASRIASRDTAALAALIPGGPAPTEASRGVAV